MPLWLCCLSHFNHTGDAQSLKTLAHEMEAFIEEHAFFPAIMLREVAEGGARLDRATLQAMAAVRNIQQVYIRAARNFGLGRLELFRRVIFPATLPQVLTGIRIALGVAWLVVVAAEMIAVSSGLGFLIIDARNAGKRYDLVVAGMVMIGLIGLALDQLVRRLENFDEVRWGYGR